MPATELMFTNHGTQNAAPDIKNSPVRSRMSSKRELSPTDETNPYKKKYFSYTKKRGVGHPFVGVVQTLDFNSSKVPSLTPVRDKENKISNLRCNANKAAKQLLSKAHRIKQNKSGPRTPKKSVARPQRESKCNLNSDFVYDPPNKKLKLEKCDDWKTELSEKLECTIKDEADKPVSVKNSHPCKLAAKSVKEEICEMKSEQKNFTDIFLDFCEGEKKTSFADLFIPNEEGKYTCLNDSKSERKGFNPKVESCDVAEVHKFELINSSSQQENKVGKYIKNEEIANSTSEEKQLVNSFFEHETQSLTGSMIKPCERSSVKKESKNPLQLKVIEKNGKVQFLNFNNQVVTFCGCCSNCKRLSDCGECRYCKNAKLKKTKGLLPCWRRRCTNPYIGKVVQFHSTKSKADDEEKSKYIEAEDNPSTNIAKGTAKKESKFEKIEACVISDGSVLSKTENGEVEFQVEHPARKSKRADRGSMEVDVFTGVSPLKRKLRSTMNDLLSRKTKTSSKSLPRIDYRLETLVKLPWPHDTVEDAAWISGHHFCLTTPIDLDLNNLCFICGSAGKGKKLVCKFCSEVFHPYCLDVDPIDEKNWCCDRCKRCVVCAFKGNLLMCDQCHDCYHADCLGPYYQRDTVGDEETWYCGKCVKCTKCNKRRAGKESASKWMFNFTMCEDCGLNWKKGNYCPICQEVFGDNDHHLKMMCCSSCECWVHMECEGITIDDYEILTDLPEMVPYICKLCSGKPKHLMPWFNEVREELHNGFLTVYYDVTTHKDLKIVKDRYGKFETVTKCLVSFDTLFRTIQERRYSLIKDFFTFILEVFETLSSVVKRIASATNIPSCTSHVGRVKVYFEKRVVDIFPWFSPDCNVKSEFSSPSPCKKEPELLEYLRGAIMHDHKYSQDSTEVKEPSKSTSDDEWAFNVILKEENSSAVSKCNKQVDVRRCILCHLLGDGEECGTGRLLYAGTDEWVHVNCALWSAEVYEDDHGRLKHVYEALKRGSKLKCDFCDQLGATIGCSVPRCPKSYHFDCACQSKVTFLVDKKIYCDDHGSKAEDGSVLKMSDLHVPRRVIVDLSRFQSLRRLQRGIDPKTIGLYCGSFSLLSLGSSLTKQSDSKQVLVPIGYKVSRIFWNVKQPTNRCKYTCGVQMIYEDKPDVVAKPGSKESVVETLTYCHDPTEWQRTKKRISCDCGLDTSLKSQKGVKRKVGYQLGCEKCVANQRYKFCRHSDFLSSLRKNGLPTTSDHNFFTIKTEPMEETNQIQKSFNITSQAQVKRQILKTEGVACSNSYNEADSSATEPLNHSNQVLDIGFNDNIDIKISDAVMTTPFNVDECSMSLPVASFSLIGTGGTKKVTNSKLCSSDLSAIASANCIMTSRVDPVLSESTSQPESSYQTMDINQMRSNLVNQLSNQTHHQDNPPPLKPIEASKPSESKYELIFSQLRDYLTKNPNVVSIVDKVGPKEKSNNVPVVNLTEPQSKRDSVCYSVYLPEHLWNDLIEAGIAKNDIQRILAEHRKPVVSGDVQTSLTQQVPLRNSAAKLRLPVLLPKVSDDVAFSPAVQLMNLPTLLPKLQPTLPNKFAPLKTHPSSIAENCYQYCNSPPDTRALANLPIGSANNQSYYTRPLSIVPSYLPVTNCHQTIVPIVKSSCSPSKLIHPSINREISAGSCVQGRSPGKYCSGSPSQMNLATPSGGGIKFPSFGNLGFATETPMTPLRKHKKRIKNASDIEAHSTVRTSVLQKEEQSVRLNPTTNSVDGRSSTLNSTEDRSTSLNSTTKSGPVRRRKKERVVQSTEIDMCTFDANTYGESVPSSKHPPQVSTIFSVKSTRKKSTLPKKRQQSYYIESLERLLDKQQKTERKKYDTDLMFSIKNDEGFECENSSLLELWKTVLGEINDRRVEINEKPFPIDLNDAYEFFGLTKEFISYLVEQLPGGHKCRKYKFQHHLPCFHDDDDDLPPTNLNGCVRAEVAKRSAETDMFAWLASPYRLPPKQGDECTDEEVLGGEKDLPAAMKYRFLKNTSKSHVGVYGSRIQGRGLFCKKMIEQSDMIIEYAGELIRASLTDRREESYEKRGIGCYMFRVDEFEVVDATMKGNSARFINHSCDPNCYSKIITVDGAKKIVIYALRRINVGEELTYDYKFSEEDDKLPCFCGSKKCRKYMN